MRNKVIKLASQLLLVGGLMIVSLPAAWAGCTPGDQKCGSDGFVLVCEKNYADETVWRNSLRQCADADAADAACTPGDQKCGAAGYVLECIEKLGRDDRRCPSAVLDQICWASTGIKCGKNIVCEPGIRRCRAGYVQECNDEGAKWENVTHVIYDGFDIFDVLGVDEDRGYTKCKSRDISED